MTSPKKSDVKDLIEHFEDLNTSDNEELIPKLKVIVQKVSQKKIPQAEFKDEVDEKKDKPKKKVVKTSKFKIVLEEDEKKSPSPSNELDDDENEEFTLEELQALMSDEKVEEVFGSPDQFNIKYLIDPETKQSFALLKHQVETLYWLMYRESNPRLFIRGGIIAHAMGLGKTLSFLALCMMSTDGPNLVVCSKTVLLEWKRNILKFFGSTCPFFIFHRKLMNPNSYNLISYEDLKDFKVIITTYDTILAAARKHKTVFKQLVMEGEKTMGIDNADEPSIAKQTSARGAMVLFHTSWHRIGIDESHRITNYKSKTFYAMMTLYGKNKICLSGSPIKNYHTDLYSQLRFIGYKSVILSVAKHFKNAIFQRDRLYEFMDVKNYKDAGIVLPPPVDILVPVNLEGQEREMYEYYRDATKWVYKEFMIGNRSFSNVLTLFLRLRQICVTAYTITKESARDYVKTKEEEEYSLSQKILDKMSSGLSTWIHDKSGTSGIRSAKMVALIKILQDIPLDEKILIFTNFKRVIDIGLEAVQTFLPERECNNLDGDVTDQDRTAAIERFKTSKTCNTMFISYKVGSEGLNLVEASHIVLFEPWWNSVTNDQAKSRAVRMGQKKNVKVYTIVVKLENPMASNIEDRMLEICQQKKDLIASYLHGNKKIKLPQGGMNAQLLGQILH